MGDKEGYRQTLVQGLRLVVVLIIPATLGLFVLAEPIIALLFEHGRFTAHDTFWTSQALRFYLVGLIFATVDWPLNYASYARQDTLTPALVGVASVGVYLAVALTLLEPMGMLGLVLADSAKHVSHALIMMIVTWRSTGGLADLGLVRTTGKALLASGVMAGLMALVSRGLVSLGAMSGTSVLLGEFILVGITAAVGVAAYLGLATLHCKDPGGTEIGDRVRHVLLDFDLAKMDVRCETLLFMASRAQLVGELIGLIAPVLRFRQLLLVDDDGVHHIGESDELQHQDREENLQDTFDFHGLLPVCWRFGFVGG